MLQVEMRDGEIRFSCVGKAEPPQAMERALALADEAEKYVRDGVGLVMDEGGCFLEKEQLARASALLTMKDAKDAWKLPPEPEHCAVLSVSAFMQIMGDQVTASSMTMSPLSRVGKKPAPPAVSPVMFGILMREARRRLAKRKKKAGRLAPPLDILHEEGIKRAKKAFASLSEENRRHLLDLSVAVGRAACPVLVSSGMFGPEAVACTENGVASPEQVVRTAPQEQARLFRQA